MSRKKARISEEPIKRKQANVNISIKTRNPIKSKSLDLDQKIGWNFSRMDKQGKFKCTLCLLEPYTEKLVALEGVTIDNILKKKHNHPMNTDKLSRDAKARVDVLNIEEETLFQLDIGTPARIWGILEGNIFHIVWLDRNHEVYLCQ